MSEKELKRKYDELVKGIEGARMFDGRNSGVDVYTCEDCGAEFYTQYIDKGVTPFTIACRSCKGIAYHRSTVGLREWAKKDAVVLELHSWVRPTFEQLKKLSPGMQDHVLDGGLVLREHLK